jgi:RecB family endonuclease NucS
MRLIVCNCRIEYEGKINTSLDLGERLILIKPDGSFSLQNDLGYKPLNYMTAPTKIEIDGQLVDLENANIKLSAGSTITVEQLKTGEKLFAEVEGVKLDETLLVADEAVMDRVGSEKDFQHALAMTPEVIEPGLVVLEREKKLQVGIIDIYCRDEQNRTVIVEVKRAVITAADIDQLARYVEEVVEYAPMPREQCRGVLVAPHIMPQAEAILERRGLEYVPVHYQDLAAGLKNNKLF